MKTPNYRLPWNDTARLELPANRFVEQADFGKCEQCGNDLDLLSAFTIYNVCGKCCKAKHKAALNGSE